MFQALTRYAEFHGRSNRWEFWTFLLLAFLFSLLVRLFGSLLGNLTAAFSGSGPNPIALLLSLLPPLFLVVPLVAVTFRRLHDANMPAIWSLLGVPLLLLQFSNLVIPRAQAYGFLGPLPMDFREAQDEYALIAYITGGILLALTLIPGTDGPNRYDDESQQSPEPRRVRLTDPDAAPHTPVFDFGPPRDGVRKNDDPPGGFGRRR